MHNSILEAMNVFILKNSKILWSMLLEIFGHQGTQLN